MLSFAHYFSEDSNLKPTRRNLLNKIASLEAIFHQHSDGMGFSIEAPRGFVWSAMHVHEIIFNWNDGCPIQVLYADALDRMSYGIEPCHDAECEWCADAE